MITLDTNLLYEYVGIEPARGNLTALLSALKQHDQIAVTSASIAEAVSKHRGALSTVRSLVAPVIAGDLVLVSIGFLPVGNDELHAIVDLSNPSAGAEAIRLIHERKLEQEASFLAFMLVSVLTGTFHLLIESRGVQAGTNMPMLLQQSAAVLEANHPFILQQLRKALEDGYSTNDVQRSAKETFVDLYRNMVWVWCVNWLAIAAGMTISELQSASQQLKQAIGDAIRKDRLARTMIHTPNPFEALAKPKNRGSFRVAIDTLMQGLQNNVPSTPEMLSYIVGRFEKMLFAGGKMEKNDVLDMLIVIGLGIPGNRLLTRDKNLKLFLGEHHSASAALNAQLRNA